MEARGRTIALLAAAALAATAAPAPAAVSDCRGSTAEGVSGFNLVTVTSVRNMSCAAARRVARRGTRSTAPGRKGGKFRLGGFSCTTLVVDYESFDARCVRGAQAFRINYGS